MAWELIHVPTTVVCGGVGLMALWVAGSSTKLAEVGVKNLGLALQQS